MRQNLVAIALMLTLGLNAGAASQNHRHTPRTEQTDTAAVTAPAEQQDAVEAFSDTTSVAGADDQQVYTDEDVKGVIRQVVADVDGDDIAGMLFVLGIILIVFLLAPVGIIIALFYFVNRNRRDKYRLAQMAMQNGQPIPDNLLKESVSVTDDYTRGIRQLFLGIGLMVFLGYTAGRVGFAVGALVFFIGLGKVVIAKTSGNHDKFNNNQNIQNYE